MRFVGANFVIQNPSSFLIYQTKPLYGITILAEPEQDETIKFFCEKSHYFKETDESRELLIITLA
jgi:hypothetical protein